MNKVDLAQLFAKQSRRSPAKAADAVDALVHRMLKDLKQPKSAAKPAVQRRKRES